MNLSLSLGVQSLFRKGALLNHVFISQDTFTVYENYKNVGTVFATSSPIYSILPVDDGADFVINENTGVLTAANDFDYETKNSYALTVRATKGSKTQDQVITITVSDVAKSYESKLIGSQRWTVNDYELTTTPLGTIIPEVTDQTIWQGLTTPAWCYRDNISDRNKLYNWYAIRLIYNDTQKYNATHPLTPIQFNIGIKAQHEALEITLGGASVASDKMRTMGEWTAPNTGATNESGFNATPTGIRSTDFMVYPAWATYWQITESGASTAYVQLLQAGIAASNAAQDFFKYTGCQTRLIKDESYNILVLGNSITKHPITSFWWGEYGMAASSRENDFVHKLQSKLRVHNPNITVTGQNIAVWEQDHVNYDKSNFDSYFTARPDIVILRLGTNAATANLGTSYQSLIDYVRSKAPNCKIVMTGLLYNEVERQAVIKAVADANIDITYVETVQLCLPEYQNVMGAPVMGDDGQIHYIDVSSVASHPNDAGMEAIAQLLYDAII